MSLPAAITTLLQSTVKSSFFHCHSPRIMLCAPSTQVLQLQMLMPTILKRHQSVTSANATTDGERQLVSKLQETFPKATEIRVSDI